MKEPVQVAKLLILLVAVSRCLQALAAPNGANQEGAKADATSAPAVQPESDEHGYARKHYAAQLRRQLDDMRVPSHWTDQAAYRAFPFDKLSNEINALKDGPWSPALDVVAKQAFSSLGFADEVQLTKLRMDRADDCAKVYRETIDKKTSDLTTRDSDSIRVCRGIASYPPPRAEEGRR
jgi:hypothetical protein